MDIELLKKQVAEDLNITPDTAEMKSLKISSIYIRYLDLYMDNLKKLKTIQQQKDKLYATLLHSYRKNGYEGFEVRDRNADTYINLDDNYQAKVGEAKDQEYITSYLEKTLEQINKVSFNIKNFVDLMKVKAGLG